MTARRRLEPSTRRRAFSLLLAIAIELLLLLAFVTLNSGPPPRPELKGSSLSMFDVAPDAITAPAKSPQKSAAAAERPLPRVPSVPKPVVALPDRPSPLLVVTKEVYAASDIAKLGSNAPDFADASAGSNGASSPGDSERVGTGLNGEPLYAAEWVREPTNRELSAYLPATMPEGGGWGLVACRTIDRFHVDDCVELGSGPPGSRLARSVRQAAWQFLVRPPRVGGKVQVGEWVRIRIDYLR